MAYLLKSHGKTISVQTSKILTRREREAITSQLSELNAYSSIKGLIIDHQKAYFDMTLDDAAVFAESIVRLHAMAPLLFIYVVVSEANRFIIDASVSLAASRGVPIKVCESKREAWHEITQRFPHLPPPNWFNRTDGQNPQIPLNALDEFATSAADSNRNETPKQTDYIGTITRFRNAKTPLSEQASAHNLSKRESECLLAAAMGLTEKETGRLLGISHNTVSVHIAKCREKLDARNKLDAVVKGIGLIDKKVWCELCDMRCEQHNCPA